MPKALTVEVFYAHKAHEGRAILRQTRWEEPLFWIIRTRVLGRWEYALIGDDGTQKIVLPTLELTVLEQRLPRYRPNLQKYHGTTLAIH